MERNNDEKKAILSITYVEIRSLENEVVGVQSTN